MAAALTTVVAKDPTRSDPIRQALATLAILLAVGVVAAFVIAAAGVSTPGLFSVPAAFLGVGVGLTVLLAVSVSLLVAVSALAQSQRRELHDIAVQVTEARSDANVSLFEFGAAVQDEIARLDRHILSLTDQIGGLQGQLADHQKEVLARLANLERRPQQAGTPPAAREATDATGPIPITLRDKAVSEHTPDKGTYVLHSRVVDLNGGSQQAIYFFAKKGNKPQSGEPAALPPGKRVHVSPRTGLPFLQNE